MVRQAGKRLLRIDGVRRTVGAAYRGNEVECPCCGSRWRKLAPFTWPARVCWHCGSLERHRQVALLLRQREIVRPGMDLLHIAPEPAVRRTLPEGINYVTGGLEPKLSDFRVDITGMPFEDGTFDALICNHVMEHVPDDRAAFREFRRVLRPGGWGIVMTPISRDRQVTDEDPSVTDPEERERRWGQWDHVRQYGWDYIDRLKTAGLEVEVIDEYSPADVERYRLINPWGDIEPLFLISR